MSSYRRVVCVVLIMLLWPGACWAQRFVPRPRPPRPPVRPPAPGPRFIPGPGVHPRPQSPNAGEGDARADDASGLWFLGGAAGFVGLIVLLAVLASRRKKSVRYIRIHTPPLGEAPARVRSAWVGLELPLLRGETAPRRLDQLEVISLQVAEGEPAYVVDGETAVKLLAEHDLRAADWWREQCSAALDAGGCLAFPADVCELVGSSPSTPGLDQSSSQRDEASGHPWVNRIIVALIVLLVAFMVYFAIAWAMSLHA